MCKILIKNMEKLFLTTTPRWSKKCSVGCQKRLLAHWVICCRNSAYVNPKDKATRNIVQKIEAIIIRDISEASVFDTYVCPSVGDTAFLCNQWHSSHGAQEQTVFEIPIAVYTCSCYPKTFTKAYAKNWL